MLRASLSRARPLLRAAVSRATSRGLCSGGRQYLASHEYIRMADGKVGITEYAQDSLGEIVFIDLPEVGDEFEAGEQFGEIESLKAASDLFLPVKGRVTEVNGELKDRPTLINEDAAGAGWMVKVEVLGVDEALLLDDQQYEQVCLEEKAE